MEPNVFPPATATHLLSQANTSQNPLEMMAEASRLLGERDGIPVARVSWSGLALHPDVSGFQGIWTLEEGSRLMAHRKTPGYDRSPFAPLYRGDTNRIRRSLRHGSNLDEFEILRDLYAQGYTDYLALMAPSALRFERIPITFATRDPAGFQPDHIEGLEKLLPLFTLVLRNVALRRGTRNLLETYLGQDAASRVLDGHIRRGEMVQRHAAVCFCDLRNFTHLSQTLETPVLLDLLQEVFDVVVSAIHEQKGDVLKFIGDAVLAVFYSDGEGDPADMNGVRLACERAVAAAKTTLHRVAERNQLRLQNGMFPFDVGLAIHYGEVNYGNIGAPDRLDFTVIGPTVNLASRLEGMCRTLGYPIVFSGAVAEHLRDEQIEDAGAHALKGVLKPVRIFGLRSP